MNLISCNYDCKYQQEGYCCLNDVSRSKHKGTAECIYMEAPDDNKKSAFNFSNEQEPL